MFKGLGFSVSLFGTLYGPMTRFNVGFRVEGIGFKV